MIVLVCFYVLDGSDNQNINRLSGHINNHDVHEQDLYVTGNVILVIRQKTTSAGLNEYNLSYMQITGPPI